MPYEIAVNRRRSRRTERECLPHAEATPLNRKVDLALIPLSTVAIGANSYLKRRERRAITKKGEAKGNTPIHTRVKRQGSSHISKFAELLLLLEEDLPSIMRYSHPSQGERRRRSSGFRGYVLGYRKEAVKALCLQKDDEPCPLPSRVWKDRMQGTPMNRQEAHEARRTELSHWQ
jgi:hypothetical protein